VGCASFRDIFREGAKPHEPASGAITWLRLASVILAVALGSAIEQASAQQQWTSDDVRQAAREARHQREVTCIFTVEVGGAGFNPYTPHGDAGVVGPGGLSASGLLPHFRSRGYDDPFNPYQVATYIDTAIDEGRGGNWPYLRTWLEAGRC